MTHACVFSVISTVMPTGRRRAGGSHDVGRRYNDTVSGASEVPYGRVIASFTATWGWFQAAAADRRSGQKNVGVAGKIFAAV
jgi:hypothetical protein